VKVTRRQLKQIIREERAKLQETDDLEYIDTDDLEYEYIDPTDDKNIGMAMNYKLEALADAIKHVRFPDEWAERHVRSARSLMATIDRLIDVLYGMGR
jgi:hypothetical protein